MTTTPGTQEGALPARLVDDNLLEWPSDEPRLRGSRCERCSEVTFPAAEGCPRCGSAATAVVPLSRTGRLWTWTRQRFQPKSPPYAGSEPPGEFEGFGVGYVELEEGLVEARLTGGLEQELRIGMPMEITVIPFADEDGTEVLTYAFRPVEEG